MWQYRYPNELYHHGIKGQKWGIRRYQNEDGSLTSEGRKRYGKSKKEQNNNSYSKYSDEELIRMTNRNNIESRYIESINKLNGGSSKNKKKAIGTSIIVASVLVPAIAEYAKELAKDSVKNGSKSVLAIKMAKIEKEIKKNIDVIKSNKSVRMDEVTAVLSKAFNGMTLEELMALGLDYWY